MKKTPSRLQITLICAVISLLATITKLQADPGVDWQSPGPEIDWPQILIDLPGLSNVSSWHRHALTIEDRNTRRFQGAIGLGNGQCFALIGLGPSANTLSNHAGPNYNQPENFFGQMNFELWSDNKPLPIQESWTMQTRKAPIAITRSLSPQGLNLYTVDFITPGVNSTIRHVIVQNDGVRPKELQLRLKTVYDGNEAFETDDQMMVQHRKDRSTYTKSLAPLPSSFVDESLVIDLGTLSPGEEVAIPVSIAYVWSLDREQAQSIHQEIQTVGIEALLRNTLDHWQSWLNQAASVQSPSARFDDLYDSMQLAIGVQTGEFGAVSPMNRYTKAWLRDTIGPLRFFTRIGRLEDAKNMLDYLYKAHIFHQSIRNSVVLAMDLSTLAEPADPATFWGSAEFMPGRNKAEAPSYLPLQYEFLYQHDGDLARIQSRYDYLRTCVDAQEVNGDGLMNFSGDETFRFNLALAMQAIQDPTDLGYSSNSAFAWVAAAESVAQMASDLGLESDQQRLWDEAQRLRQLTDYYYRLEDGNYSPILKFRDNTLHPRPFEDVSTKPLFFGYSDGSSQESRDNVSAYIDVLLRDDGTLLSPWDEDDRWLESPMYTGMVPGLFLNNVALVDHPMAEAAFNALATTASPSGMWQEIHWKDHTSGSVIYSPSGRSLSEVAARYRPWEGGENLDAAVLYLTGAQLNYPDHKLKLAPHLPTSWPYMNWNKLPAGPEATYDLSVSRDELGWQLSLTLTGDEALSLDLTLSSIGIEFETATVDAQPWQAQEHTLIYEDTFQLLLSNIDLTPGQTTLIDVPFATTSP